MWSNITNQSPKKSVAPSENIKKASGNLDDIKVPVVMIRQKYLDNKNDKENTKKYNFQGQYKRSKRCFDIDHERLEIF